MFRCHFALRVALKSWIPKKTFVWRGLRVADDSVWIASSDGATTRVLSWKSVRSVVNSTAWRRESHATRIASLGQAAEFRRKQIAKYRHAVCASVSECSIRRIRIVNNERENEDFDGYTRYRCARGAVDGQPWQWVEGLLLDTQVRPFTWWLEVHEGGRYHGVCQRGCVQGSSLLPQGIPEHRMVSLAVASFLFMHVHCEIKIQMP